MVNRNRPLIVVGIIVAGSVAIGLLWLQSQRVTTPEVFGEKNAEEIDPNRISEHEVDPLRRQPKDAAFYYNRGNEWFGKDEFDKAISDYSRAIKLNPNDALALSNRGLAWRNKGETDIALLDFDEAIRLDPANAGFRFNRGNAWYRKREYDKAIADYSEAVHLNPEFSAAFVNRGEAKKRKDDLDGAIADYGEAIRVDPSNSSCFLSRGNAWFRKGEYDNAIADFSDVIRLDPKNAMALYNRGIAWNEKDEFGKALNDFSAGMGLDPNFEYLYDRRAWLMASCPVRQYRNGPEAIKDATRACEISNWKSSTSARILGAAYAEAGDFPQAIKWVKKAMEMDGHERELCTKMLALFEAGQPYRDDQPAVEKK